MRSQNIETRRICNGSKKLLKHNGQTVNGKVVLSGESIFRFVDTKGIPLENILMVLDKDEYSIDWIEFVEISKKSGWKIQGTLVKIENGLSEIWGKEYSIQVLNRLTNYLDNQSP